MIRGRIKKIVEEEKKRILSKLSHDPVGCLRELLEKAEVDFTVVGDTILVQTISGDTVTIKVGLVNK
jgi:hypothetical protein